MISISDNLISEYYKSICKPEWEKYGYAIDHYEAVTPRDLSDYNDIKFATYKGRGYKFTETEKAIWYSHYNLWHKCLDMMEPIVIIEHDCYPERKLFDMSKKEIMLFCTFPRKKNKSQIMSPCGGYYITPKSAIRLIHKATEETITFNVDWTVHETFDDFNLDITNRENSKFQKYLKKWTTCKQIYSEKIGSTIEHNLEKR